jgi:hypothetical protein
MTSPSQRPFLFALVISASAVSHAFAGTFTQNFESITAGTNTFTDGSLVRTNQPAIATVFQHLSQWKALRLTQDGATGTSSNYFIPSLEPVNQMTSFSATFDLLIKKDSNNGAAADSFSFNVGTMKTTSTNYGGWDGMYDSNQVNTGPILSVVWDTYNNGNDPNSIEVFLNGVSIANSTTAGKIPYIAGSIDIAGFRSVSINWENNLLDVSYGGQVIFNDISTGSFTPAVGDQFALFAGTGAATQDVFVDNMSITTVPEASTLGLLLPSAVLLLRRRRAQCA